MPIIVFSVWMAWTFIGEQRAFAIFQRLVPQDAYEGTGIGLAVCKKIVEHHGGRIWIDSEVGQGSNFFMTFPVAMKALATGSPTDDKSADGDPDEGRT